MRYPVTGKAESPFGVKAHRENLPPLGHVSPLTRVEKSAASTPAVSDTVVDAEVDEATGRDPVVSGCEFHRSPHFIGD